jgi:hypothetical protein
MKRKTIIIGAAVYLGIIGVILLVSLLVKDSRLSQAEDGDGTTIAQIDASDSSNTPEMEISDEQTPLSSTPTNNVQPESAFFATAYTIEEEQSPTLDPTAIPTNTPILQPTNQVSTSIPSQTPTTTPTTTMIPTDPIIPQNNWEGEWTVYLEQSNGLYQSGPVSVTLGDGGALFAEGFIGGFAYNFQGTVNADETAVNGRWTSSSVSGNFFWILISDGQFGGNLNTLYGICGARSGFEQPFACYQQP